MDKKIIERLKIVRSKRGLTQKDICKKLGISQTHLSQVEKGKSELSTGKFFELLRILDCEFTIVDTKSNTKYQEVLNLLVQASDEL